MWSWDWKEEHVRAWEKTRIRGSRRFVVRRGILGFGLFMAIAQTVWPWSHKKTLLTLDYSNSTWMDILPVAGELAMWIFLAGISWGVMMWNYFERKYREATGIR